MRPLEAVAIAAYQEFWRDDENSLLKDMTPEQREASLMEWRKIARAAITALRDAGVSEGMVNAAHEEGETASFGTVFRAMLDVILEEK